MIRLFVGIELPEDLRRRMALIQTGVERAKWVAEENIHLTLRFIGEVAGNVAADVGDANIPPSAGFRSDRATGARRTALAAAQP